MRINVLEVKNIKKYEEETIFFPKGLVLLYGEGGCGKSSPLLAIELAFFGIRRE